MRLLQVQEKFLRSVRHFFEMVAPHPKDHEDIIAEEKTKVVTLLPEMKIGLPTTIDVEYTVSAGAKSSDEAIAQHSRPCDTPRAVTADSPMVHSRPLEDD